MGQVVSLQKVTKEYGTEENPVLALRGIDLDINENELFMLVGPSGCGKTTLLSIIAGILDPTEGICEVLSRNLAEMHNGEKTAFRAGNVGFVFQAYNLLPAFTAAENVALPLLINGVDRKDAIQKAEEILAQVGLTDRVDFLPENLSGGQQQRVAVARAIVHDPQIIVCDEPTSALDHQSGEKIMEVMKRLVLERGHTLVIVTHDSRIFHYADRIGHMDDGKIVDIQGGSQ